MKTNPSRPILIAAIMGGILAVSTASILIRYAQGYAPSLVIAALRLTFATLIIAPYALIKHRGEITGLSRNDLLLGLLAGFFLALHFATWISSLEYTTIASSVVLVTTTPLWVALLSPIFLKESITRVVAWGMVLALIGCLIIGVSEICNWNNGLVCPPPQELFHGPAIFGDLLALVGAWMAAGYLMIGRKLRARTSLIPYIFIVYGMAALVLLPIMSFSGESIIGQPPQVFFWTFLLALIPQLLGHSTFNWALKYLPASLVSVTLLGEPIGSIILAYAILSEIPSTGELTGAILILLGIVIASRVESPKSALESKNQGEHSLPG